MTPNRSVLRICGTALIFALAFNRSGNVRAASSAPKLPDPTGRIVNVSTDRELQAAVQNLGSDTTIVLAAGTYRLTSALWINGPVRNVSIRGESGTAEDVVLVGPGMRRAAAGDVPYGIFVGGGAQDVEIANLTIRDIYDRAVVLMPGTMRPHIYNVHFIDSGEPFIDARSEDDGSNGVVEGLVEYSRFEYSTTAREASMPAVSVRAGSQWTFRHNEFRNIVGPSWQMAGPAIAAWGGSIQTTVDSNTFVNCSLAIALGSEESRTVDHQGGVVRNNMIFRATGQSGAAGIRLANAPAARVLNNTVFLFGTYGTPIEYQFEETRDVVVANNLIDGAIWARDGATGTEAGNFTAASADMFADAAHGDLHLTSRAVPAIDRGVAVDVANDWDGRARPAGRGYDIGAHEFGATITAQATRVGISGRVVTASGAAVNNVTIRLAGPENHAATTNGSGAYNFPNVASGDYTITPSLNGYSFTPPTRSYTLTSTVGNADFVATAGTPPTATTVTLTSPANNTTLAAPATINFAATVTGGSVTRVAFFLGSTSVASSTTAPYTGTAANVAAGTYSAYAVAYLSNGTSVNSPSATVVVSTGSTPPPTGVASLTASPASITAGATSTLTLTMSTTDYHNIFINGTRPSCTYTAAITCTLTVTPTATTTYRSEATNSAGTPYTMPSTTVTVTGTTSPTPAPTGTVTFAASPTSVTPGQPSTLTLTMPGTNYHNVMINGVRVSITPSGSGLVGTLAVTPAATTTYQSAATDSTGVPYALMPSVTVTVSGSAPPPSTPVPTPPPTGALGASNLVQQGSFTLPQNIPGTCCGGQGFDETAYMNGAVAFNAARQSLFIVGHDWGQHIAELSIPADGGQATILQPFVDALYGQLALIDPDQETKKIGGLFVDGSNLLVSGYTYYDGVGNATASHFSRSTNLSNTAVAGPLRVGTLNPGFVGGYFAAIPSEWQAALGGDLLVGQCCLAVVGRTSFGPAAFAVRATDIEGGANPVAAQPLAYYDELHQNLGPWSNVTQANPVYNMTTSVKGAVIPQGTSTALFFGNTGLGVPCYGAGTADQSLDRQPVPTEPGVIYCYDPANGAKGTHAYPYAGYVWAYNLADFAAVRAGSKAPWDVKPYASWSIGPFATGAAYDPGTGRIFLTAGGNVLVYTVQ